MAIEEILYVGTDIEYVRGIENEAPDTATVDTTETVENVDSFPVDRTSSVVIVDTTSVDNPTQLVQSLSDRLDATPVVAVVESTTDPLVVFDVLMAGAVDYVERGAPSGRPTQLLAHLEATSGGHSSVADDDNVEQRFRQELQARRRTEQRLTTVLDRIPQPVFYRDADGVYLGCNAAFEELCGQPREEIVGCKTEQLQNQELADICEQHDDAVLRTGEKQTIETIVTVQGEQRHIRVHKAPLAAE